MLKVSKQTAPQWSTMTASLRVDMKSSTAAA